MKTDAIAPKELVPAAKSAPAPKKNEVEANEEKAAEKAAAEEASTNKSLAVA